MTNDVLRRIAWRDLFPWLILFRTFRIAISPALLVVATLAVLISPFGWRLADLVFQPGLATIPAGEREAAGAWRNRIPRDENSLLRAETPSAPVGYLPATRSAIVEAYFDFAEPLRRCFQLRMTVRETAYYAFGTLWTIALWSFPGGMITRRAIVQLSTDGSSSILSTAAFTGRRLHWYFLTPLYPLLGIVALAVPIALLGLPLRLSLEWGAALAGVAWILVAIAGLAALWLFGGLLFGWPLMWPTISAERDGDPFEAFSRSYSYVYGKPLHYFFYVVIAAAFGALCLAVVQVAATLVQEFGFWALAWGGGGRNVELLRTAALDFAAFGRQATTESRVWNTGASLVGLVLSLIHAVTAAFRYTYFFSAASAIYLLLRHDVDEKEMDEVYIGEKPPSAESTAPAANA